jgi:hypothetical protein
MLKIAQIGAMTRPEFRNMPTLDFGGAVDNFMNARDKSLEAARRQAYVDELTQAHPEDAAKIAANPEAYVKMMNDNAAAERDQQFKMDMLDKQFNNSIALQDRQYANAVGLAKLAAQLKGGGTEAQAQAEQESYDLAQNAINQLYDVAQENKIGVFTDWLRNHGLTGKGTEQEYGRISSAVAGLAPRAISKLKAAGVSGINSLPEFMTYIGLPQNPTSQQIMGAIPLMAQIAGVENPVKDNAPQTPKFFANGNNTNSGTLSNGVTWRVK